MCTSTYLLANVVTDRGESVDDVKGQKSGVSNLCIRT